MTRASTTSGLTDALDNLIASLDISANLLQDLPEENIVAKNQRCIPYLHKIILCIGTIIENQHTYEVFAYIHCSKRQVAFIYHMPDDIEKPIHYSEIFKCVKFRERFQSIDDADELVALVTYYLLKIGIRTKYEIRLLENERLALLDVCESFRVAREEQNQESGFSKTVTLRVVATTERMQESRRKSERISNEARVSEYRDKKGHVVKDAAYGSAQSATQDSSAEENKQGDEVSHVPVNVSSQRIDSSRDKSSSSLVLHNSSAVEPYLELQTAALRQDSRSYSQYPGSPVRQRTDAANT